MSSYLYLLFSLSAACGVVFWRTSAACTWQTNSAPWCSHKGKQWNSPFPNCTRVHLCHLSKQPSGHYQHSPAAVICISIDFVSGYLHNVFVFIKSIYTCCLLLGIGHCGFERNAYLIPLYVWFIWQNWWYSFNQSCISWQSKHEPAVISQYQSIVFNLLCTSTAFHCNIAKTAISQTAFWTSPSARRVWKTSVAMFSLKATVVLHLITPYAAFQSPLFTRTATSK